MRLNIGVRLHDHFGAGADGWTLTEENCIERNNIVCHEMHHCKLVFSSSINQLQKYISHAIKQMIAQYEIEETIFLVLRQNMEYGAYPLRCDIIHEQ